MKKGQQIQLKKRKGKRAKEKAQRQYFMQTKQNGYQKKEIYHFNKKTKKNHKKTSI